MKSRFVLFVAASLAAVACSSSQDDPYGPTPDFGSIDQQFNSPSGSFVAGRETAVFTSFSDKQQSGQVGAALFPQGSASSGTTAQAAPFQGLHALGLHELAASSSSLCAVAQGNSTGTGSCSCPGGGSVQWDFSAFSRVQQGGTFDAVGKLAANACKSQDGSVSLDGKAFLDMKGTAGKTAASTDLSMIFDEHFAYTAGGQSGHVDIDFEFGSIGGQATLKYLVQTDDGTVVVGGTWDTSTKTGQIVVQDKTDTWTCQGTDGKTVTCTDTKGDTRNVTL